MVKSTVGIENVLEVGAVFKNGTREFKVLAIRGDVAVVERLNFELFGKVEYIIANGLIPQEDGTYIWCYGGYFYGDLDYALYKGGFKDLMGERGIVIDGYEDETWYVIDEFEYHHDLYYLLESEVYGDEEPCLITDRFGNVIVHEVWNGFDDLITHFEG